MFAWILLSILLLLALLGQTIRITDMKGDIFRQKSLTELNERDEKNLADRLQDMTVSRDHYAEMYQDACDEMTALHQQVSRMKDDLDQETALSSRLISDKEKTIQRLNQSLSQQQTAVRQLKDRVNDLERRQCLKSHTRLSDGLGELMRFVSANQWIMENNRTFAEAVASVSEVAEAIAEREN
jgi:hypothetical protein